MGSARIAEAQSASFLGFPIAYWDFESNAARSTTSETTPEMQINSGNTFDGKFGNTTTVSQRAGNGVTWGGVAGSAISATTYVTTSTDPGIAATTYFQFSLNTTGFSGISVGVDIFTGITGAAYPATGIIYSTNGGSTWTSGSAGALGSNNTWATKYFSMPAAANNNANVKIRIYGYWGANNANSVVGLDNLMVLATGTQTSAGSKTTLDEGVLVTSYTSGTAPTAGNLYNRYSGFTIASGSELIINNTSATSGPKMVSGATLSCASGGQVTFGSTGIVQGAGNFTLASGGILKTAHLSGITSSGATGSIQSTGTRTFSAGANYIYNGAGSQVTGNGLPASFVSPGSVTINNASGVTLSQATAFATGDTVNLINGAFTITPGLTMASGSYLQRDLGTVSATPSMTSVNLVYKNLGVGGSTTTGNELPSTGTSATAINGLTIAKSGATITLSNGPTINGALLISAGTLSGGSVTLTAKSTWTNNAAFGAGAGAVVFNGSTAQSVSGSAGTSFNNLTISNSSGVSVNANTAVAGGLNFTSGIIDLSSFTLTVNGTVTGAGASSYVKGNLQKPVTGVNPVNFEIGDNNYAPALFTFNTAPSGGTMTVKSTNGVDPAIAGSGISTTAIVTHYWTVAAAGLTGTTTVTPNFTYNVGDIGGGTNAGFVGQIYSGGSWLAGPLTATNTTAPYTSQPSSALSSGAFTGNYIFGKPVPQLIAAVGATVDAPFTVTFIEDAAFRTGITQIKVGSNILPGGSYNTTVAGQVTFDPSVSAFLQTAGTFVITMTSTGYGDDAVSQPIGAGVSTNLAVSVQPTGPPSNGGVLAVQPVILIRDQYNNTTTSTATVTANVGAGAWTIGGATAAAGVAGTVTFAGLTASSGLLVTGATISFTSPGLTSVTSAGFNIPRPPFSGTINVPGDYATLGQAIAAVNASGLVGPTIINCTADQASTTTAGNTSEGSVTGAIGSGYIINVTGAYAPTATNTLTIRGNHRTITTPALPTATNYNDAVFTIAGTSYVTIDNFVMAENAANTTVAASNNMTEFGVAIVRGSTTTSGSQYNTISNCRIQLGSTYTNSIGIYSNADNNYSTAYTSSTAPTSAAGANSYNTFSTDTIIGATSGIVLLGDATYNDLNAVVGGSSNGDSINLGIRTTNMVMGSAYANYNLNQQNGVYAVNNNGVSVTYNAINLATGSTTNTVNGIFINTCASSGAFTSQATNNRIRLRTGASTQYAGIQNASGSATNATLKFNNNTIYLFGVNGVMYGIVNSGAAVTGNFNSNFINDTTTTTATSYNIYNTGAVSTASFNFNKCFNQTTTAAIIGIATATGAISTCNYDNNTISTLITGNPTAGSYGIFNNGISIPSPSFSNNKVIITAASNTGFNSFGIYNTGAAPTIASFSYDTVTVSGPGYGIVNAGNVGIASFNNNVLSIAPGNFTCFGLYNAGNATTADFSNNNISTPIGTTGVFYGINLNTGTVGTTSVNNNTINLNVGSTGYGMYFGSPGTTLTASNNNITMRETGAAVVYGIYYAPAIALTYTYMNYNTIDISTTTATTTNVGYIYMNPTAVNASGLNNTINNNIFKSTSGFTNTSGIVYFVYQNYENATDSICYNRTQSAAGVGGTISKTGSGGTFYGVYFNLNGSNYNGTYILGNNFSGLSFAGTTVFHGINDATSTAQNRFIANDTMSNITGGTGLMAGVILDYCSPGSKVNNNVFSNWSSGGNLYGIVLSAYTSPATNATTAGGMDAYNNTISNFSSTAASGLLYGIYFNGSTTAVNNAYNNEIYNFSVSGNTSPVMYGINHFTGTSFNAYNNYIHDFTSTTTTGGVVMNGIFVTAGTTNSIYKNRIYNLSAGTATGAGTQVIGMNMVSSAVTNTYNVYNNFITALAAPSSNNPNSILGLNMQSATNNTWNIYYNTIATGIGGAVTSSNTNFGAAGILFPNITSSVLNMADNIVYMNVTPKGTGIAACIQRNATGTANTSVGNTLFKSNNNIYYTNSSSKNYLYVDDVTGGAGTIRNGYAVSGLTFDATNNIKNDVDFNLCGSLYKAFMGSGRESKTSTENNLTSAGTTGTYYPSGASYAYGTGAAPTTPVITDDYAGVTRANPPSIGALEFAGSAPTSGAVPTINYTVMPAVSYCITAPPSLTAAITSGASINTTAGTKPRMYYRGSSDANALGATNTSSTDGWKYVEGVGAGPNFTFTPDYSLLNHSVVATTVISYFIIAQDLNTTPLVGTNIVGFAANYCPASVALTGAAFPTQSLPTINTYTVTATPGSFTAVVSPNILCGTTSTTILSLTPASYDLVLQWKQDYGSGYASIPGATTNNYVATPPVIPGTSATVNYKADVTCNSILLSTSSVVAATEYSPSVTTTTPGSRCGAGSVTLAATAPGGTTLQWYDASTGGLPLATGPSFATPSISSSTIYYVADTFGNYGSPQSIGMVNIATPTLIGATAGPGGGVNFTVNNTCVIQSVKIYPLNSGVTAAHNFTISVYSGATIVASYSGTVAGGAGGGTPQVVPVNFYLAPGNYQMSFSALGASATSQYAAASGFSFPYTVSPNTITLTSTTFATYYLFFFDWKVVASCTSPRTAVTATINSLPTAGTVSASPATLCVGASLTLSETGTPIGGGTLASYNWTGPNGYASGGVGPTVSPASFTTATTAASGVYSLTVTYPGTGCTSNPVTTSYVTVNGNNTPNILGTMNACVGSTRNLSADIPSGTWISATPSVATIDAFGVVTAVSAGTSTISYTTPCGAIGTSTFTTNITPTAVTGVTDICVSTSTTLSNGVGGGTWTSSNTFAASINSSTGYVTSGASTGSTNISYTIGSCAVGSVLNVSNTTPGAITGTTTVCVGALTTLSCSPSGGTWTSGSTSLATVSASTGVVRGVDVGSPTITYSTGCGAPATATVTVNGSSITLGSNGPVCAGTTASLSATVAAGTYAWTGPNSFSSALQNPTIPAATPAASGTYNFSVTVSGCTSSSTIYLPVDASPTVTVTASNPAICLGGTSMLTDIVTGPTAFMINAVPYSLATLTSPTTLNSGSSWTGGNDDGYINVPLLFNFSMYGTTYTTLNISPNGYINFGTLSPSASASAATLPSSGGSTPKNMIALFWHDMIVSTGSITYGVMGTAPNRTFIVNYNAVPDASGPTTNTGQIVLYETSNNIDLMVSNTSSSTKTCGVQNLAGTSALTANGQNNATYAITATAPQGWRFSTPSYNYAWSPAASLSSSTVYNPLSSGLTSTQVYTVSTNDIYSSCSGIVSTTSVTVNPVPVAGTITPSATELCSGGPLTLTAGSISGGSGAFVSYVWSGPGGYTNTVTSVGTLTVAVSPTITGSYSVLVNYAGSSCAGVTPAVSSVVTVTPQPAITSVTPSLGTTCAGTAFTITSTATGGVGAATYTWSGASIATTTTAAGTSPVFSPTLSGTNAYSLALHYDGVGCNDAYSSTSVTTNPVPSVAMGSAPNICQPTTSAPVAFSTPVGSPTHFSIDWDATATSVGGFSDVSNVSLAGGSAITLTYNPAGSAGSFDGQVTFSNGVCVSSPYPVHTIVYANPEITSVTTNAPCVDHSGGSIEFTGTDSATVVYSRDGVGTSSFTFSGTNHSLSTGIINSAHTYLIIDVHNPVCTTSTGPIVGSTITVTPTPMAWVGGTVGHEAEWNNVANWTCGMVPVASDNVLISSVVSGFDPVIPTSFAATTKDLTINSGGVLVIDGGGQVDVKGAYNNSNHVYGNGKVVLNGTSAQTITGIGTTDNLELDNAAGATIDTGSRLVIANTLYVTAGTLTTNDSLELASTDTFTTARIAALPPSGASISGKVKVDQYVMGGYRRYRFISHPFSDTMSLGQIQKYIDITGPGGNSNGFVTTGSNAPSAFRLDPYLSNSSMGFDPGWRPFTKISSGAADSNKLRPGQGIRLFFRGAKGEGLSYLGWFGMYTPSPTTYKMLGNVNQGDVSVTLARGSVSPTDQDFNMVGNPYPSPVDMGTIIWNAREAGQVTGTAFYVFDPAISFGGNFVTVNLGLPASSAGAPIPYYVQGNTAIQVRADHDGAHIDFTESDKSALTSNYLFRAPVQYTALNVYDENYHLFDMLKLNFNDKASDNEDAMLDAVKPMGASDFNFYSVSADKRNMAIDSRPYAAEKVIPLGIASGYQQNFIIRADNVVVPEGGKLVLHDKLLEKYVDLNQGTEYRFAISKEKATQGNNRFELALKPAVAVTAPVKGLAVSMSPNPATDDVKISFTSGRKEKVTVRVMDITGVNIYNKELGEQQNGTISVPLSTFAAGIYMVELTQGDQKVTQRLVKE